MAELAESPIWEEHIYRIQVTDPIQGGDGIANVPPKNVNYRTAWLKKTFEEEHQEDGHHVVTNKMVAADAGIVEDKLVLDFPTTDLYNRVQAAETDINSLVNSLAWIVPIGSGSHNLLTVLKAMWKYADFPVEYECFSDGLTLRHYKNVEANGAIAYDDSVDVSDSSGLAPGMKLLIYDYEHTEEIEILSVLERGRIRLTKDLQYEYDPLHTIVGFTNWDIKDGYAYMKKGERYYSDVLACLRAAPYGKLIVRMENTSDLVVRSRDTSVGGEWKLAPKLKTVAYKDNIVDVQYKIEGGDTQLFIECANGEGNIYIMMLFPMPSDHIYTSIRTPEIMYPFNGLNIERSKFEMRSSYFRCIYKDHFVSTEFQIFNLQTDEVYKTWTRNTNRLADINASELPVNGTYGLRCRHLSDIGEYSEWSDTVTITLREDTPFFGFTENSSAFNEGYFFSQATEIERFGFIGAPLSTGFDAALFTTKIED